MGFLSKVLGDIPILGDVFEGIDDTAEAIVKIGKLLLSFFTEIDEIFKIIIGLFKLVKEFFMGGIVFIKSIVEILLNSLELLEYLNQLLMLVFELVQRYIPIPMIFIILTPFLVVSYYYIDLVDSVVELI